MKKRARFVNAGELNDGLNSRFLTRLEMRRDSE